jgi:hypothetical protein
LRSTARSGIVVFVLALVAAWPAPGHAVSAPSASVSSARVTEPASGKTRVVFGPRIAISGVVTAEGDVGTTAARATVSLDAPSGRAVTVDYESSDASATVAGGDYDAMKGTLTFAPGETSKEIAMAVHGDATPELDESVGIRLLRPVSASFLTDRGDVIITNDDAGPCPDDPFEENDDIAQAAPIAGNATLGDLALCVGDPDLFAIDVPAGQTLAAVVSPDVTLDATVVLLDAAGFVLDGLADAGPAGGQETVSWTNTGPGPETVLVRIDGYGGDSGHYRLSTTLG